MDVDIFELFDVSKVGVSTPEVVNEGEALTVEFEIPPGGNDVQIDYEIEHITTEAADFSDAVVGSWSVSGGNQTASNFSLLVNADSLYEKTESFKIHFKVSHSLSGSTLELTKEVQVTNIDPIPQLQFSSLTVNEGDGTTNLVFSFAEASAEETVFRVQTNSIDTNATDYTAIDEVVVLPPGTSTHTIVLPILDDSLDEIDERLSVLVSEGENISFDSYGSPEVTIIDNDNAPDLSVGDISIIEGDTGTVSVVLSAASGKDISFDYTTADGVAVQGTDYTSVSGTATIPAGSTSFDINIVTLEDLMNEGNEGFVFDISNPVEVNIVDSQAAILLVDDDGPPSLIINDVSVDEGDGVANFTVSLSAVSALNVTFDWASSNATALSGSDYTANSGTGETILAGNTSTVISIVLNEDTLDELDETFEINLSNPANAGISDGQGIGTIQDNDATPSLSIASESETEDTNHTFTVTLSAASGQDVTFDYATSDGTAIAGTDYTANSGSLTITAGNTTQTFSVVVTDDALDEVNETYTATISNPGNATISTAAGTGTIQDNDATPSLSISSESETEDTNHTFTVTLSAASGQDVTFDYATSNGTAVAGSDYTANSGSLTITAGSTTQTFTVVVADDALDEANETFTATISNPGNATISTAAGTGTIQDNDATPSLSIASESETEDTNHTFTVTLSAVSGQDVTFDYATSNGTAISGSDYTANSGSLTITAGSTTQTFTVVVADDALDEVNETYTATISNPGNATISTAAGTGTIQDNDATPSLSIADESETEDTNHTFTVTLSAVSGQDVTFDYATSDGTAVAGSDYTANSGSLTITAGSTTQTFTVVVADDALDEVNETFTATISNPGNATISTAAGTGTIQDNDATPSLSISSESETEDTNHTFTVTLSAASGQDVTFDYATSNGTAVAGSDYTANSGSLTITAGSTTQTFTVVVADDALDEVNETFTATISNPGNATISTAAGTGTIQDNDVAPSLSISSESETEDTNHTFTVTLSAASGQDVTFDYATSNGTAVAGSDYTANSGSLIITAGNTTQTFSVVVADDALDEANETFTATISNPGNATISTAAGTGTIQDNDTAPSLSISSESETEDTNHTFTVTLSAASGQDVTFDYATSNGTAVAGSDYTAASGSLTITAGNTAQTFTVVITDDALSEVNETYTATISNPGNATISTAAGTGTITDNEGLPSLSISSESETEDTNHTFTVTLSAVSGQDVTFDYATSNGTAVAGSDYTAASGSLTITAGNTTQTFSVVVADDALDEANETFTATISNPGNATISTAAGTGTIQDNDATPSLSISSESETEDTNHTFTVTLSAVSGQDVTFDYATSNGTAVAGSDYTAVSGSLTINAGSTTQTFTVVVADDALDEANETFTATISNPGNATISTAAGTGTIQDNDATPSLSISSESETEDTNHTFTVTLSTASGQDVTFDYATSNGTAVAGSDYTANSGSLTITAGSTTQTFTVVVADDALNEVNETYTATISNPGNATISTAAGTGTIQDNDATPSLSISSESETEDTNHTFTVTLSAVSGQDVTFDYATSNGTAVAGSDYTAASGSLTITAGNTTQTFTVVVTDDGDTEANETYTATISNPGNATISTAAGTGTIQDNDSVPTLSLSSESETEGTNHTFTVTLSAVSGQNVTFDYATSNGTAVAGSDYTANSGSLTITAGNTTQTFTVVVADDALDEVNETYTATISNPGNATISTAAGTGTIQDNDATPSLSIASESETEDTNHTFTVTLSAASGQDVTFDYVTSNGTAIAGSDYSANSGSLTITAGNTTQTFTVVVSDDALDEANETYTATISNPGNATISTAAGTGTIQDNDATPSLSIASESETEDTNHTFTVTLSAASGQDVTFDYATSNGTAVAGSDYTANSGSLTITAGNTTQTFTVVVADDALDEANETYTATISNPGNATISTAAGTGTIQDNDATPSLSIASESETEDTNHTFTVTLSAASGQDVTFDYATSNGTAVAGSDYTANSGSLTITAGNTTQTFTVVVADDALDEVNETYTATISNPGNATISTAAGTGTIQDNDATPNLSVSDESETEGTSQTFTVTLSAASGQDVTFDWYTADDTATSPGDYTAVTTTAGTITAGNTSVTVTVNSSGNTVDEGDRSFEVWLVNPGNATISDNMGVGTIQDDDTMSLSIADLTVGEGDTNAVLTISSVGGVTSTSNVTFRYATGVGNTATDDVDFDAITAIMSPVTTITAGNTSATISIPVYQDTIDENVEYFGVLLAGVSGASVSDGIADVYITDDDAEPTLSISAGSATEASPITYTVNLSHASEKGVSFDWETISGGTATAGSDYTAVSETTVNVTNGDTSEDVTVTTLTDSLDEPNETVRIQVDNQVNAVVATLTGDGTINDDDAAPDLSINDPSSVEEGNNIIFTVSIDAVSGQDVTFDWATADGSGSAGTDYTANSGSGTITAGNTSTTVTVATIENTQDESNRNMYVNITNIVNAGENDGTGRGTISDDDDPPEISIADVTADEGSSASFSVTLNVASGNTVTVDYATSNGTATAGTDYTSTSGTLTFNAGETSKNISVSLATDGVSDDDETFTVTLSNATSSSILDGTGVGTINQPDITAPAAVSNFTGPAVWSHLTRSPTMTWDANGEGDLNRYEIEIRLESDDSSVVSWTDVGVVTSYQFLSGITQTDNSGYYANIKAIDDSGNESATTRIDIGSLDYWLALEGVSITKVDTGGYHACAIIDDGVKCWGHGTNGKMGNGTTTTNNLSPVDVSSLSSGVQDLSVGVEHACVVHNGAAKCWGFNGNGRLGNGNTTDQTTPTQVSGLTSGVSQISAGHYHTCAVVNGGAKCWGLNFWAQLGDGTATNSLVPVDVSGHSSGVQKIVAGQDHSCLLSDGGAYCWGSNQNAELGNNDAGMGFSLTSVAVFGMGSGVQDIAIGRMHTCGIQNGQAKCWGFNGNGELGDGTTTNAYAPVAVTGLTSGVQEISAEAMSSCALVNGGAKCWGFNGNGEFGDGTTTSSSTPVNVPGFTSSVSSIKAGPNFSCAIKEGGLWCWGFNGNGRLGDGTGTNQLSPVRVDGLSAGSVKKVVTNNLSSCMVYRSGAYCWGLNDEGQVGDGTQTQRTEPTLVSGLSAGVQDIQVGDYHTCALVNGGVKCWGANWNGQVGDSSTTQRLTPVDVTGLTSGVSKIAIGSYHGCAIKDGGMKCWGYNADGAVGDGTTTSRTSPVDVSGLTSDVQIISAGYTNTCAVTDGQAKCWGKNNFGQTGMGSTSTSENSPVNVSGLSSGLQDISNGARHTCAAVDGEAKCWGHNGGDQLGNGGVGGSQSSPVTVTGLTTGVTLVDAGNNVGCALVDGGAQCWGYNTYGEVGDDSTTVRSTAVDVNSFTAGVVALDTGYDENCGIKGGVAYCWGRNNNYQLGDGTTTDRDTPVAVDIEEIK